MKRRRKYKKNRSEFGKITWYDLWKGLYHGAVAVALPLVDMLLDIIFQTNFPTVFDWRTVTGFFISAFIGSIIKSGATNSDGEVLRREKYVDL